jgi:hypothetical protein
MNDQHTIGSKRRFTRIPFHAPAVLGVGGLEVSGQVLDLSLKGALVEIPASAVGLPGDPCTLAIRLGLGEALVRMDGRIVHRGDGRIGVCCSQIDLESMEHLHRLVELNLGDESLLRREIAALVDQGDA